MRRRKTLRRGRILLSAVLAVFVVGYAVLRLIVEPRYLAAGGPLQFADVASPAMAEPDRLAQSACWADIDRDGDQDLFVANSNGPNRLWRNDGQGGFVEIGAAAGVSTLMRQPSGCAFADLDNDGDPDLFISGRHDLGSPNSLLRNDGGRFTDVSATARVQMNDIGAASSDWADVDGDGDYDGFVAARFVGEVRRDKPNAVLRQIRPLVFADGAADLGLADPAGPQNTYLGAWADYDNDGDLDVILAVDWWGVELYQQRSGTIRRVTLEALPPATDATPGAPPNNPMGLAVGDYNNDGCLDFYATGMNSSGTTSARGEGADLPSRLYRNKCNGTFTDVTQEAGFYPTGVVEWAANFIDYDNDGDLDLAVVAGNVDLHRFAKRVKNPLVAALRQMMVVLLPQPARLAEWAYRNEVIIPAAGTSGAPAAMPNFLYKNLLMETGQPRFVNVTHEVGLSDLAATRGSAWADIDNDGDLDWFVPNLRGPNRLFRNDGPVGHYLRVHLVGAALRDAVGAHVRIQVGERVQYRHVHVLDGYLSQSQMDPHFGLGAARQADVVWVRWPGSTRWVRACGPVAANRVIRIHEGRPGCG
jgi:hypothetical protein